MDYEFSRVDYTICGITYPDTLKILPAPSLKVLQKFVVGDKNGVLQCLSIKDEEPVVHFKSLPGKPITSVQLASIIGTQSDKIFAASGNEVKGYTRKGKVFLTIDTSLSDTITSMCVLGVDLILCSGRTVTHYKDLREFHSYICDDRVLDIAAFSAPNSQRLRLLVLIANKGAILLENGQKITRTAVLSGPTRMIVPLSIRNSEICAFYGSADGSLGILTYEDSTLSSTCLVEGSGLGAVVCMGWYLNPVGAHLALGRNDGSIQLYLIDNDNYSEKPRLKYTYFCGEPITSVSGGWISSEESELLAASFSGRIFSLRSSRWTSSVSGLGSITTDALASRRSKLEGEIARLEKQIVNEREKYQKNTRSVFGGLSTPPLLDIQIELLGATFDGWQEANIISAVPLDMLFIFCDQKLEMQTDSIGVLSICPTQESSSHFLATVRCQAGTRRLWMRLRHYLNRAKRDILIVKALQVLVYTLPAGAPRVARVTALRLSLLPYYSQHEDIEKRDEQRSWCELQIKGNFSVAEMTSWLKEALPGDLPRPATNVSFARRHSLLHTILICQYQRGAVTIRSDNLSTIVVLQDTISSCALEKSIKIDINTDIPNDCCLRAFQRIEDQFREEYQKKQDNVLKNALSALDLEFKNKNDDKSIKICEEYLQIWNSMKEEKNELKFEELVQSVGKWYYDWQGIQLQRSDHKIKNLYLALESCNIEVIKQILEGKELNNTHII